MMARIEDRQSAHTLAAPSLSAAVSRKQLLREIPMDLIDKAHRHLYIAGREKEWDGWIRWAAVEKLTPLRSKEIWR